LLARAADESSNGERSVFSRRTAPPTGRRPRGKPEPERTPGTSLANCRAKPSDEDASLADFAPHSERQPRRRRGPCQMGGSVVA
jgi:hypothetical protein